MKFLNIIIAVLSVTAFSQSYSEDQAEIYTANNQVENTLNTANNILCIISKIKAEQFIDKGPYKAQLYEDRCDTAGARADAQAAAQGGQQQAGAPAIEIASTMIVDVKSAFSEIDQRDYIEVKSWFYMEGDYSEAQESYEGMWDQEPDQLIYALTKVWSGATEEDPNGDLELDFVVESNCKNAPFQSDEEARAAAAELGLTENTDAWYRHMEKFWKCMPAGNQMGSGKLDTTDGKVLFIGPQGRNIQLTENENGRDGVWSQTYAECIIGGAHIQYQNQQSAGCGDQSDQNDNWWFVDVSLGFSYDEISKVSCKKMVQATRRQFDGQQQVETDVTAEWKAIDWNIEQYPWLAMDGPAQGINEVCESTAAADAKLAVWEYGLYTTADDLRYDLKKPGFELKSDEEFPDPYNEDFTHPIYAWADYWGTHVGQEWRSNLTETTAFSKVNSDDLATYNLKQRKMSLRKMSVDNVSLDSLSGVEINLHIEWDLKQIGDECWWNRTDNGGYRFTGQMNGTRPVLRDALDNDGDGEDDRCDRERWQKLGVPVGSIDENGNPYTIFMGYWDATAALDGSTAVGQFIFDTAVVQVNNRWVGEVDITPFSFTPAEYLAAWDDNLDDSDGYEIWRNLWAHGRGQGYEIKGDALADPSSNLVSRRTEKDITAGDLAGITLGCIERCLSGGTMKKYFDEALALIATGTEDNPASGILDSPYTGVAQLAGDADAVPAGPYVRSGDRKGDWTQQGVLSSEVVKYQGSGDTLVVIKEQDAANTPLELPAKMYELGNPWAYFEGNICIKHPNYNRSGDTDCWGMKNHMTLFDYAKVSQVECDKTRDTDGDGKGDKYEIHESSEVQTSTDLRLCNDKLWQMDEYYEVHWDPWVNYQVYDAAGALVEISRPEGVTLSLPNDKTKYGKDAGKKKTLEYAGFGRLHGFEWTNFDIKEWEDKGEYFDWNSATEEERQNIRGFPTYVIPDGTIVMAQDGVTELKSKFLRGEYYLKPLPSAVGSLLYTTDPQVLVGVRPEVYDTAFIGPVPEDSLLLNGGEACVDHGEILAACQ